MEKLKFGTAGIRGILGEGEENLNKFHLMQVIDGFANYLIDNFPNAKEAGVIIGRDNRREGKNFSEIAASILLEYGIKVYYNKEIAPTPFISYATRKLNTVGAINITASHNPKEYNGIKLYDKLGCQLLPKQVNKLLTYFKDYNSYLNRNYILDSTKNFHLISEKTIDFYLDDVKKIIGKCDLSNIKVAFTPQHGTGAKYILKLFKDLKVDAYYEEHEMIEDTEFSYSSNPNPEAKESFDNVLLVAKNNECDIALVTDPDSDRVGIAVKNEKKYEILTGNETAILIFNYLIEITKLNKEQQYYLIYSFVSSSLPKKIAVENGINSYITETGFKWIGNLIENLSIDYPDQKFLFAFEESYGSLINENICRDKDAIQSVVMLAKITSFYKNLNLNLIQVLNNIYEKYGFVESGTILLDIKSDDHLENIKKEFKSLKLENATFLDYNDGIRSIEPNDMLAYEFENGSWVSLRPSGTEPKIKIYLFFIDITKNKVIEKYNYYLKILSKL